MVDYLRKSSEALILLVVALSPWAFGGVHAISRYFITAALGLVLVFWAVELLIKPRRILTRFQIPLLLLFAITLVQLLPLGSLAALLSPQGAQLKAEMMPAEMEVLADGNAAEIPFWTARGKVSIYPAETLRRLYWFTLMALLLTRVQDLASVKTLRRLCFVCLINGSILSYFAVFQHFTAEPRQIYWNYESLGAAFGPFVNRNHFAFYINICFGLSLGLVGSRLMGKVKSLRAEELLEGVKDSLSLWMISVLVFMLGAVILCSSRGGMISLVGGTLITAVFIAATGSFHNSWKWFLLAAGIFAVAAGVQTWLGFDFVDSRYAMHDDNRTTLWLPLMGLIPKFPLTGTGLGTLAYAEPFTRTSSSQLDTFLENAHNEYLQLVLETGIPGLLCGLALLVLLIAKIASRVRSSRHNAWLYVGALFGLCTVMLHSFVEFFGYSIPATTVLVAVLFGHIAGLGRVKATAQADDVLAQGIPVRVFAVLLLLFAVFAVRDAKRYDMADRSWRLGQRAQKEGHSDAELQYYFDAIAFAPNDVEFLLDSSRIQFQSARAEVLNKPEALLWAQQDLIRARELSPLVAETQFLIGQAASSFAKSDGELTYYDRALKPRPADETLRFIIGEIYWERQDHEAAAEQFRNSLSLSTRHLDEILEHGLADGNPQTVIRLLPADGSLPLMAAADWLIKKAEADGAEADYAELVAQLRRLALETPELVKPTSGELYYRKGELLRLLGQYEEAVSAYKRALNYEPSEYRWRLQLASTLGELKQYEDAERQLKRIRQSRPGFRPAEQLRLELSKRKAEKR